MANSLEEIYKSHHAERRNPGFTIVENERAPFFKREVGQSKRVLDIGCRDGALTKHYNLNNEIIGVDIDPVALRSIEENLKIKTMQFDLNSDWPIEPNSFDVVVIAEVLEHLYYPWKVLGRINKVLKSGGKIVGSVPNAFSLKSRIKYLLKNKKGTSMSDPTHINHLTVVELKTYLEKEFTNVEVTGFGRLGMLAHLFPQTFAFGLLFTGVKK